MKASTIRSNIKRLLLLLAKDLKAEELDNTVCRATTMPPLLPSGQDRLEALAELQTQALLGDFGKERKYIDLKFIDVGHVDDVGGTTFIPPTTDYYLVYQDGDGQGYRLRVNRQMWDLATDRDLRRTKAPEVLK